MKTLFEGIQFAVSLADALDFFMPTTAWSKNIVRIQRDKDEFGSSIGKFRLTCNNICGQNFTYFHDSLESAKNEAQRFCNQLLEDLAAELHSIGINTK